MNTKKIAASKNFLVLIIILFGSFITLLCVINGSDRAITYGLLFIIVPIVYITGVIYGRSHIKNRVVKILDTSHDYSIFRTFIDVFFRNSGEILLITIICIVLLLTLAFFMEDRSKINPTSMAPTTIGLLLSLVSVIVTIVGMFYAFLAEKRAHQSEKMSRKSLEKSIELLADKGDFIEHFSGFINRINKKLDPKSGGILSDINNIDEEYHYDIKCMFLTPFLGHAGITPSNGELHKSISRFQSFIHELIESSFCRVKILCLGGEQLVKWYAQIQWIEEVKKKFNSISESQNIDKKLVSFANLTDEDKIEIITSVIDNLTTQKGTGVLKMDDGKSEVRSFSTLKEYYRTNFSGIKGDKNKLEIFHSNYIPFQIFLVMKRKIEQTEDDYKNNSGKFVVLTFVGDKTYYELIKDMTRGEHPRNGGIDDLLTNLHSAFYSEDPRICKILNNHFEHYWDASDKNHHFPDVNDELWADRDIYNSEDCLPKECLPTISQYV
ncbi:MAG: hypothetical protein EOM59_11440 [Clostridia bacterium]|nr:hypothetical protein [Clostridia bacterium]